MTSKIFTNPPVKLPAKDPNKSAQLLSETNNTMTALQEILSSLTQEQINLVPFEGSWTAGQVAEHFLKADSGIVAMVNGEVQDCDRKPDEKVQEIRKIMLDFSLKMESPDFVLPENKIYRKDELQQRAEKIKTDLEQAVKKLDLARLCVSFEIPVVGKLTRMEAIYFTIYHTQRHVRQLKNIFRSLSVQGSAAKA